MQIDKLLLLLRNRGFPADTPASLNHVLDSLRSNLFSLNTLVGERITLASRAILLDEILKEHEETMRVLGPWIINVNNDVRRQRAAVDDSRLQAMDRSSSEKELITSLTLLTSLQQILQSVTEIHASLLGAASAEKYERRDLLKLRIQWSIEARRTWQRSLEVSQGNSFLRSSITFGDSPKVKTICPPYGRANSR